MKKNIYYIDVYPMAASKILEAIKAFLNDENIEANLRMILANIGSEFTSSEEIEYYKDVYNVLNVSFEENKNYDELEHTIKCIDNKKSLVLLNAFMSNDIFYFCRNLLDTLHIKYVLIGVQPWYEDAEKYDFKIKMFSESYLHTTRKKVPEIFEGKNLRLGNFDEQEAKRLLGLR